MKVFAGCVKNEKYFLERRQGIRTIYEIFKHENNNNRILARVI